MFKFIKNFISKLRIGHRLYVAYDSGGKSKPTIVLLHGIAALSKIWDPLLAELDTKKYRVICIDLLGFGQSPKPESCRYTVDDHTVSIHRALKKLKVKKPFKLVGHSMGSIVAARYARLYQKEIKHEYLLSLPFYNKNNELHTDKAIKQTDLFMKAYDFLLKNKKFTINSAQYLRKFMNVEGMNVTEDNWHSFELSLKNTIMNQDVLGDIRNTKLPIDIIYGSLDEFLVQRSINKLSGFKNVKVTRLAGVDHRLGSRFAKAAAEIIISN